MARTKSISAIETEIAKLNASLAALQKRQDRLTKRLQTRPINTENTG